MEGIEGRKPNEEACGKDRREIDDELIIALRDLSRIMRTVYEGRASQKRILMILHESGPITQSRLTERLRIRPGSASEVLAKLENAGLICRSENRGDRRTADVALTESGVAAAEEALRARRDRHREMFSCLSAEEKNTLLSLLDTVRSDWTERYREKIGKEALRRRGGRFRRGEE